jgi:DHA1 family purine ribonucleoside efflux pump-like MFS transporter
VVDQAETAGGIQVAVIQIAILVAAAVGGVIVDRVGVTGVVMAAGVVMILAAGTVFAFVRSGGGTLS